MSDKPEVLVVVSIDTEEDQWGPAADVSVENIRQVPEAAARLAELGIRPTWFTAWTVLDNPEARAIMQSVHRAGHAEVAAHLHPWNTPPDHSGVPDDPRHTMLCNLPIDVQRRKLKRLTDALTDLRGSPPTSFRAGRWGLGGTTVQALVDCGYRVDSSVMPFITWAGEEAVGPSYVGAPFEPYRLSTTDVTRPDPTGHLVEVPASVGFTRRGHKLWRHLQAATHKPSIGRSPAANLLWRSGLLRKVILSPELHPAPTLLQTARALVADGAPHLHLFWHSQSMTQGLGPFKDSGTDGPNLFDTMERFVDGLSEFSTPRFCTVTEAADHLQA